MRLDLFLITVDDQWQGESGQLPFVIRNYYDITINK